jgi:hypothetical protein
VARHLRAYARQQHILLALDSLRPDQSHAVFQGRASRPTVACCVGRLNTVNGPPRTDSEITATPALTHARLRCCAGLGFNDGVSAVVYPHADQRYIVTSATTTRIPQPLYEDEVHIRPDCWNGLHDYVFRTQWYNPAAPHLARVLRWSLFVTAQRPDLLALVFDNLSMGAYMFSFAGPDKVTMRTEWADRFWKAIREPCFHSGSLIREGHLTARFDLLADKLTFMVAAYTTNPLTIAEAKHVHWDMQRTTLEMIAIRAFARALTACSTGRRDSHLPGSQRPTRWMRLARLGLSRLVF